jgi:hypothetical protein
MSDPALTDRIITQGRALEALITVQANYPIQRALARLLLAVYKRRLMGD